MIDFSQALGVGIADDGLLVLGTACETGAVAALSLLVAQGEVGVGDLVLCLKVGVVG